MNRLASPAQLRASLIRWALFIIPTVMLLGFLMRVAGMMVTTTLPVIQRERIVLAVPLQPLAKKVLIQ